MGKAEGTRSLKNNNKTSKVDYHGRRSPWPAFFRRWRETIRERKCLTPMLKTQGKQKETKHFFFWTSQLLGCKRTEKTENPGEHKNVKKKNTQNMDNAALSRADRSFCSKRERTRLRRVVATTSPRHPQRDCFQVSLFLWQRHLLQLFCQEAQNERTDTLHEGHLAGSVRIKWLKAHTHDVKPQVLISPHSKGKEKPMAYLPRPWASMCIEEWSGAASATANSAGTKKKHFSACCASLSSKMFVWKIKHNYRFT